MPLAPSHVPIVAELIRQGRFRTPHIPLASQLWLLATSAPPRAVVNRPRCHGSMFHRWTKPVPRVSYRGQKGIPSTHRVSPQQAETGQLLQHPDPAGPGADPSLVAVEDRLPGNV